MRFTRNSSRSLKRIAPLLLLIGGLLFVAALYSYFDTQSFLKRSEKVSGEVTNLIEKIDSEGDKTYAPSVKYIYEEGEHSFESSFASNPPRYSIGEKVEILIDPTGAQNVKINGFWEVWIYVFMFCVFGFASFSVGLFSFSRS